MSRMSINGQQNRLNKSAWRTIACFDLLLYGGLIYYLNLFCGHKTSFKYGGNKIQTGWARIAEGSVFLIFWFKRLSA